MQKSVRQSMAWLHSWLGLLLGWLLFCIFLTGTLTYYKQNLNLWTQPTLVNIQVNQQQTIQKTVQYLQENAADAQTWFIQVAHEHMPVNKIYWQKADGSYESKILNPNTGKELKLLDTPLGDFFYNFHFQLYAVPYYIGRLIVSFAAFIMLICLISGIITHKKIFTDFFTLRTFKGPRSYLDFHNISAVIALPFFLTITFTGLAIFFYLYFPQGLQQLYPKNSFQYFEEINTVSSHQNTPNLAPANMLPIHQIQDIVSKHLGQQPIYSIEFKKPNTQSATASFIALQDNSITKNSPQITLNVFNGHVLAHSKNTSPIATLNAGVYGLHMAKFAQPFLRLGLFFSGILGCMMIASGLLLWSLKRQIQKSSTTFHFGYYWVNRLNISTIIGLPIAISCSLLSNRINLIFNQSNSEIHAFFSVWLCCLILSLLIKQQFLWSVFLKLFILVTSSLIIANWFYLIWVLHIESSVHYLSFIYFDLLVLVFIVLAIFALKYLKPIQQKVIHKIKKKSSSPQHEAS